MNIDEGLIGKPPNVAHVINSELIIRKQQETIERLKRDNEMLKARNQELDSAFTRMDDLLVQKQYVIDAQRESIKKLDRELANIKIECGITDNCDAHTQIIYVPCILD